MNKKSKFCGSLLKPAANRRAARLTKKETKEFTAEIAKNAEKKDK